MQTKQASVWRFHTLLAAPHRLSFFSASGVMALVAAWWWFEIMSRAGAWPSAALAVPATVVHALVMSLGFLPLFFGGFLFTAGPKWLQMPEVPARLIVVPVLVIVAAWVMLLCGAAFHPYMAALGSGLAALGWAALSARFIGILWRSPARDKLHASLISVACVVGVLAMVVATLGLALADYRAVRLAALLGLWWFVVPVYVTVAHRMIPFFTASAMPILDAWRPHWLLWTLLSMVGVQGLWVLVDAMGWQDHTVMPLVHACASGVSGAVVLALALRWGLIQSLRIRLLAMLHIGFVWLGIALCLDAASTLSGAWGHATWPLLPLHALTMGFLASVMMAMVARVSCGHGGRTLTADNLVWGLFWGLQLATVLRLTAALWPAQSSALLLAAACIWLLVMLAWALRYGRWYGRPRIDGRPG
ncbi:MAG: NnrS family protein [Aquabacterium sp.]|nr:NnrS family protein [Aquabacterium sp.]